MLQAREVGALSMQCRARGQLGGASSIYYGFQEVLIEGMYSAARAGDLRLEESNGECKAIWRSLEETRLAAKGSTGR
jgi:hypothetical protein